METRLGLVVARLGSVVARLGSVVAQWWDWYPDPYHGEAPLVDHTPYHPLPGYPPTTRVSPHAVRRPVSTPVKVHQASFDTVHSQHSQQARVTGCPDSH